ncbi:LysR substrate-binding domain-containing protein [Pasteurellaceae bacterium LIM206]|nr:LysR substrate-binding domain-containing protein [Pasteurellaceae bacterium LIM206]
MNITDNLNIKAIQLFIRVYHTQSFSEVARQADTSPAQVSRIIRQLEDICGKPLFYRNTRAVIPTEAGNEFFVTAQHILEELTLLQNRWQDQADEPSGLVRLNAPVMFAKNHIVPYLPELLRRYPKLELELTQTDEFIDPHSQPTDLLFRVGALQDSGMKAKVFGRQQHYLAASPGYLRQFGTPQDLDELYSHQCLPYRGSLGGQHWLVREGDNWKEIAIRRNITANNALSLVDMAVNDMGILLFPDWLLCPAIQRGELVRLMPEYTFSHYPYHAYISALYPNSRHPQRHIRSVLDFFSEKFGEPPYWQQR